MREHIVEHTAMPVVYTDYTNLYKIHQWDRAIGVGAA